MLLRIISPQNPFTLNADGNISCKLEFLQFRKSSFTIKKDREQLFEFLN